MNFFFGNRENMTCNTAFTITLQQGRTRSAQRHPATLLAPTQLDLQLLRLCSSSLLCAGSVLLTAHVPIMDGITELFLYASKVH